MTELIQDREVFTIIRGIWAMKKQRIDFETLEEQCKGCQIAEEIRKRFNFSVQEGFCLTGCPVGKGLKKLGVILTNGTATKEHDDFTEAVYLKASKKMTDREIIKHYNVPSSTLHRRKKAWGLIKTERVLEGLTTKKYLSYTKSGLHDREIAEILGVGYSTLRHWKADVGVEKAVGKLEQLLQEYTKRDYMRDRLTVNNDHELAEKWGVSFKTFSRWKSKLGITYN